MGCSKKLVAHRYIPDPRPLTIPALLTTLQKVSHETVQDDIFDALDDPALKIQSLRQQDFELAAPCFGVGICLVLTSPIDHKGHLS